MTKFIIVGIQRAGTTLVRTTLDNHPDINCMGEMFYAASTLWISDKREDAGDLWKEHDISYGHYVNSSLLRRAGHIVWRKNIVKQYLDRLYAQKKPCATGFKFMLNHLRKFPYVATYVIENNIKVIHVVRENVFDVYLSRLAMLARGYAHSTNESIKKIKIHIPLNTLHDELDKISHSNEKWNNIFNSKTPYHKVGYDEFVRDRQVEMANIAKFLEVDSEIIPESSLKKLNSGGMRDMIKNYDDVIHRLEGTRYEWCLKGRE